MFLPFQRDTLFLIPLARPLFITSFTLLLLSHASFLTRHNHLFKIPLKTKLKSQQRIAERLFIGNSYLQSKSAKYIFEIMIQLPSFLFGHVLFCELENLEIKVYSLIISSTIISSNLSHMDSFFFIYITN